MPVDQSTVTKITCDNPNCPGPPDHLSPDSAEGWILVSHEVYGLPSQSSVFCSPGCTQAMEPMLNEAIENEAQRQQAAAETAAAEREQTEREAAEAEANETKQ